MEEWLGDAGVHVRGGGVEEAPASVTVRLGAGDAAILHFKVKAGTRARRVVLKTTDGAAGAAGGQSPSLPSLRRLMPEGKHIGAAMHYDSVQASKHADAAQYAALQASQFAMAQDKNCMNWAFVEYAHRGVFRWGASSHNPCRSRALACAARALNATGQSRVTLSLQYEHCFKRAAACGGATAGGKASCPETFPRSRCILAGPADSFVAWCRNHSTLVRGHALAWGAHLPAWLLAMAPPNGTAANASTAAAIRRAVNESVTAMVGR